MLEATTLTLYFSSADNLKSLCLTVQGLSLQVTLVKFNVKFVPITITVYVTLESRLAPRGGTTC